LGARRRPAAHPAEMALRRLAWNSPLLDIVRNVASSLELTGENAWQVVSPARAVRKANPPCRRNISQTPGRAAGGGMMSLPTVPRILLMALAAWALVVFAVWWVLRLLGVA
jgi:hypothetical protein